MTTRMDSVGRRASSPSPRATEALGRQLEAARRSGRLDALVLADSDGLLIASAGDREVCVALGALAPLGPRSAGYPCLRDMAGGDVTVRTLTAPGYPLFLAALGGTAARDALLSTAMTGVSRILSAN